MYRVRLWDNLIQLAGPAILLALLLLLRANRKAGAWAIWIPVIVVNLLTRAAGLDQDGEISSLLSRAQPVIEGMCYGYGAVWLTLGAGSRRLGGWWYVVIGATLASIIGFAGMRVANASGGDDHIWLFAVAMGASWFALALAGRLTRRRFTCMRWGVVALCVLATSVVLAIGVLLPATCPVRIDAQMLMMTFLVVCPVLAATAAVPVLPYVLLCAFSRFYRARLMFVLGVDARKPAESQETAQAKPPVQP